TESDRRDTHEHFVWRDSRTRHVAHFDSAHVAQHTRFHRTVHFRSVVSNAPASRKTENRSIVSRTPISSGVEGKSPRKRLIAVSSIAGAIGIGGPPNVIESPFTSSLIKSAIRWTVTVSPCRLKTW